MMIEPIEPIEPELPTGLADLDEIERDQLNMLTAQRAAAFIAHHLRGDAVAQLSLATTHMRGDPDTWLFLVTLTGMLCSNLRDHYGDDGAAAWAETLVRKLHEDQ